MAATFVRSDSKLALIYANSKVICEKTLKGGVKIPRRNEMEGLFLMWNRK